MKKTKLIILALVFFTGIAATHINNDKLYEISKNIELFINVFKELNANYVDDIDPAELMRTGIDAMVGSLDPYTNYISEAQVESYRLTTEGTYDGIGAVSGMVDDQITIMELMEGAPAVEAGLKVGDVILAVNSLSTEGKTNTDLNQIVRGVPGTALTLKVLRDGKAQKLIEIKRGNINVKNVPYSGIVSENIGYVSLTTFTADASKNIEKAIKKLKRENKNLGGIILDLRSNGGGLLHEAVKICNLFLPQGELVVSTRGKVRERDQFFKTTSAPLDQEIPLVVLINKSSASASEIVSGTIQDLDRGVILGQRSYGKGLVQNHKEVGYNSRIKVTTSKYYIPSGRCIQSVAYEDGKPVDIPDDKRSTFYTKNRRPVLDGGGITPDIKTKTSMMSSFVDDLYQNKLIFKYVNNWSMDKDSIAPLASFSYNDFSDFVTYVGNQEYNYQSKTAKLIKQLKEQATEEGIDINSSFDQLTKELDISLALRCNTHKEELERIIEGQIVTRYYYQTGKVRQRLEEDAEIDLAIEILNDSERYNSLLKK